MSCFVFDVCVLCTKGRYNPDAFYCPKTSDRFVRMITGIAVIAELETLPCC